MNKSVQQIQIFYELAMVIGRSLNFHEMLRFALLAYLRKLNCVAGMVYKVQPSVKSGYLVEDLFSIPYTLNIRKNYAKIDSLLPNSCEEKELIEFRNKLPLCGEISTKQYYHIMELGNFGFLVLIKSNKYLDTEVVLALHEINNKLAQACFACLNNEALIESEKKYRDLGESLPEMICETDIDGYFTWVNNYASEKMGYLKSEIDKGFHFLNIFHPDERQRIKRNFALTLKTDNRTPNESKVITKNGTVLPVIVYTSKLIKNDKTVGIRGVMIDITERKNMEQSIIDERDKARQANMAKSEFLANMSHEIRTPMNAILGFSQTLLGKTDNPEFRNSLETILTSGRTLLSLLNDILDLSKIETGRLEIVTEPVNLHNIIREVKDIFKETTIQKELNFQTKIDKKIPTALLLDEIRIRQILFNLVGNATKFTEKGYIRLAAFCQDSSTKNRVQITFEIEDTGIGIPTDKQKMIFEAFRQAEGNSSRKYGGTGLGLTITKKLVEQMNGEISLRSTVGEGTLFKVVIPDITIYDKLISGDLKPEEDPSEIIFKPATILVVADIQSNIDLIKKMIDKDNFKYIEAKDFHNALQKAKTEQPDITFMDLPMDDMETLNTIKKIRKNKYFKRIPVIACADPLMNNSENKIKRKFDSYLRKPISKNQIYTELKRFIPYKTKEKIIKEEKEYKLLANLTTETKERLPELLQVLSDEYLPYWEKIKNTLAIFKIEKFAKELKTTATEYKLEILNQYCDSLLESIRNFDIRNMEKELNTFPQLLHKIENHYKKSLS